MLNRKVKDSIIAWMPSRALTAARKVYHALKRSYAYRAASAARRAFETAEPVPEWLAPEELPRLHQQFPFPPPTPKTEPERLEQGRLRMRQLLALLSQHGAQPRRALETGCGAGLTAIALQSAGMQVDATDWDESLFSALAKEAGVNMQQMDAASLQFDDNTFDLVYSYGAFEHFPDPETVLAESLRVLRPGGYLFAHIGPLYMSAQGLHGYRVITAPFVQHLFEPDVIAEFATQTAPGDPELRFLDDTYVNRWRLAEFRRLWRKFDDSAERLSCIEIPDNQHISLIQQYPSCFRSKSDLFDEFMIGWIELLLRKR